MPDEGGEMLSKLLRCAGKKWSAFLDKPFNGVTRDRQTKEDPKAEQERYQSIRAGEDIAAGTGDIDFSPTHTLRTHLVWFPRITAAPQKQNRKDVDRSERLQVSSTRHIIHSHVSCI